MDPQSLKVAVYICAYVCDRDGVISHAEEKSMKKLFNRHYSMSDSQFENALNWYCESDTSIDEHLLKIADVTDKETVLAIAKESAASDGLHQREGRAYKYVEQAWGF